MAQPRLKYDPASGEMVPETRQTVNGAIETLMSDGSWAITQAAPGPTTWTADTFDQFWNNPEQGGRFDPRAGDIFPIATVEDMVKWGFGNQSPDPLKGLTEWLPGTGMSLQQFQDASQSLPFVFNEDGTATYDPTARVNPLEYVGPSDWRETAWPLMFALLAGGAAAGGLGGAGGAAAAEGGAAAGAGAASGSALGGLADFSLVPAGSGVGIGGVGTAGLGLNTAGIGLTPELIAAGSGAGAFGIGSGLGLDLGATGGLIGETAGNLANLGGVTLDPIPTNLTQGPIPDVPQAPPNPISAEQAPAPVENRVPGDTGGPIGGGGVPGGTTGPGSIIDKIIDGTMGADDWLGLIGKLIGGGIGYLGSKEMADAYTNLNNQLIAQRAPFLNKATGYLNDPSSFYSSPEATGAANATMRALSTQFGNPGASPTAQSLATGALFDRYQNTVNSLGSLGLSGQGIQANLGSQIAGMSGQPYAIANNLIGGLTTPSMGADKQLADTFRSMFKLP